jgi:hypothetical protein
MTAFLSWFPALKDSKAFEITSPFDVNYNCIAWAAQDLSRNWWPDSMHLGYWPPGVPREETIEIFAAAYRTLGYEECDSAEVEPGFQKIALYALSGKPKHAARQLPNGHWTSKLGKAEDIQHALQDLEGQSYGQVVTILRRRRQY